MQDLKDTTQDVHYENFRAQCISQISQQALRDRSKVMRESELPVIDTSLTETDRLLIEKDQEVIFRIILLGDIPGVYIHTCYTAGQRSYDLFIPCFGD